MYKIFDNSYNIVIQKSVHLSKIKSSSGCLGRLGPRGGRGGIRTSEEGGDGVDDAGALRGVRRRKLPVVASEIKSKTFFNVIILKTWSIVTYYVLI